MTVFNILAIFMFLLGTPAICWGIRHEDKLVKIERGVIVGVRQAVKEEAERCNTHKSN